MRVASLAEVKAKLSAYVQEAGESGPVLVTRNGKAVAVIVAPTDDDITSLLLSRSPRFRRILAKSRRSIAAGQGQSHAAFWKKANE